jgi:hypothetical protein
MSDRLPATLQSYKDAAAKVHSIAKTWGPQWPTPDPEIIWYGNGSKRHADILGRGIETPWGKGGIMRVQNIGTPEGFEAEYHAHTKEAERKSKFKSQRGMKSEIRWAERSKARIEPAHAYWGSLTAQGRIVRQRKFPIEITGKFQVSSRRTITGRSSRNKSYQPNDTPTGLFLCEKLGCGAMNGAPAPYGRPNVLFRPHP